LNDPVERERHDLRPGGAADNSPAHSAPGKWEIISRPVGTLEVLTHTLKPSFISHAYAAHEWPLFHGTARIAR